MPPFSIMFSAMEQPQECTLHVIVYYTIIVSRELHVAISEVDTHKKKPWIL